MSRSKTPKQFSAYIVTWSDQPAVEVDKVLIDKGTQITRTWNWMNFDTNEETHAVGRRLARLCPECKVNHSRVGILGHDGECGSDDVMEEGRQVLADAEKRVRDEVAS